ncbi:MAG: HsdM family class I SAM-dependent methyltransferase [Promethearchaeota archaeon]
MALHEDLHEANVDFDVRRVLEEVLEERGLALTVRLQPRAGGQRRADILVAGPLGNLLVLEDKVADEDVFDVDVQLKARAYANELGARYFAVTNLENTLLFKNGTGPLYGLLVKDWVDRTPQQFRVVAEEVVAITTGEAPTVHPIDGIVREYEEFFRHLVPQMRLQVSAALEDPGYRRTFDEKLTLMGLDPSTSSIKERESNRDVIAQQAAYLYLNQVFFFELLLHYLDRNAIDHDLDSLQLAPDDVGQFEEYLRRTFEVITTNYDFKPIFQHDCVFRLRLNPKIVQLLKGFAKRTRSYDLQDFDHGLVAQIYQNVIPGETRKKMGQIYTPPAIARLMTVLAIDNADVTVLDPACGCGTFLKEAYQRLKHLKRPRGGPSLVGSSGRREGSGGSGGSKGSEDSGDSGVPRGPSGPGDLHNEILSQLWGVEINTFPAHLTTINLSFQQEPILTDVVNVVVSDFLRLEPLRSYTVRGWSVARGENVSRTFPRRFDVVIGNPPYVRHELLGEARKSESKEAMEVFANYLAGQNPVPRDRRRRLHRFEFNQRVDYYAYFLWASSHLLADQGVLCFIVPNKWLDVGYGREVKRFLLDHYAILSIVGFERNVFQDVDVATVIVFLKKEARKSHRDNNWVKFVQVKKPVAIPSIVKAVKSVKKRAVTDEFSVHLVKQGTLDEVEKWTNQLVYVPIYEDIKSHPRAIPLDNGTTSTVDYGTKSGANGFFFLTPEEARAHGIPGQFLVPGIKSARNIPDAIEVGAGDVAHYFLLVPPGTDIGAHPALERYVQLGEDRGFHRRRSFRGSVSYRTWRTDKDATPWYSFPKPCFPTLVCKRHVHEVAPFVELKDRVLVSDGCKGITIRNPEFTEVVHAVLCSSVVRLSMEMEGRAEGAGELQLMKQELSRVVILNPQSLTTGERKRILGAFRTYRALRERGGDTTQAQRDLDASVLAAFGLEGRLNELYSAISYKTRLRTGRQEEEARVLV